MRGIIVKNNKDFSALVPQSCLLGMDITQLPSPSIINLEVYHAHEDDAIVGRNPVWCKVIKGSKGKEL